jgi:RHS repeat-associated protein
VKGEGGSGELPAAPHGDVGAITETDFGFTGQRAVAGFGLMDYHARYYSPTLGRFTQPDTLTPGLAARPAGIERYGTA